MAKSVSLDVNVENEQVALATFVKNKKLRDKYVPALSVELFQDPVHKALLVALKLLVTKGADSADDSIVQLSGDEVTLKYLKSLHRDFDDLPEANLKVHVSFLERDAGRAAAQEPFAELYDAMDDAHSTLEVVEQKALAVARAVRERRVEKAEVSGAPAWTDVYESLDEMRKGKSSHFVPMYFSGLDDVLTEGMRRGRMSVVAGRPGMGKSTLVANLVLRAKIRSDVRILACPFEDTREAMAERMGAARGRVDAMKMVKRPADITDEEAFRFKRALRELFDDGQITFADQLGDVDALEGVLSGGGYGLVVLDLFDYLLPPDTKPGDVTTVLRRLRNLSKPDKDRKWPGFHTVVCHQIRRTRRKKNPRPYLNELKSSGGYEEVADQVFLIHRDRYYHKDSESDVLEINVAKQRRGPMNVTMGYDFDAAICRVGRYTEDYANADSLEEILGGLKPKGS